MGRNKSEYRLFPHGIQESWFQKFYLQGKLSFSGVRTTVNDRALDQTRTFQILLLVATESRGQELRHGSSDRVRP
jgi:hypothetical protein